MGRPVFIAQSEIVDYELSSPFTYLCLVVESRCSSEMMSKYSTWIRLGASNDEKEPLTLPVERFFAFIRFEQREKLAGLPMNWSKLPKAPFHQGEK